MRVLPIIAALLIAACASSTPRHLRKSNSLDREVAAGSMLVGVLVGFGGCVAGFAGAGPIAFPLCVGGWALGMGSIGYLTLDDSLRTKSYIKAQKSDR